MARKQGSKNYAAAFKRQVVAETFGGPSVAAVARKHGLNANMVHLWRRDARFQPEAGAGTLLPVEVVELQTPPCSQPHTQIEVVTRGGHRVIVSGVLDPGAIAGLVRALDTA
ncbi:MAG: transposase [Pseudomonadota bacterium]